MTIFLSKVSIFPRQVTASSEANELTVRVTKEIAQINRLVKMYISVKQVVGLFQVQFIGFIGVVPQPFTEYLGQAKP